MVSIEIISDIVSDDDGVMNLIIELIARYISKLSFNADEKVSHVYFWMTN